MVMINNASFPSMEMDDFCQINIDKFLADSNIICTKSGNYWFLELGFYLNFGVIVLLFAIVWQVFKCLKRLLVVSIQVSGSVSKECSSNDYFYHHFLKWMKKNCKKHPLQRVLQLLTAKRTYPEESEEDSQKNVEVNSENAVVENKETEERSGKQYEYEYEIVPEIGYGTSQMIYDGAWIHVKREVMAPFSIEEMTSKEILTVSTFFWNKEKLLDLVEKGKPEPKEKEVEDLSNNFVIYKAIPQYNCWERMGKPKRKLKVDNLVLDGNVIDRITEDVKSFLDMSDWYFERGIPYRRGYLLYGPPGCGKSSIVKAIASSLSYDICIFSLSQNLTDTGLTELFNNAPAKSILLLEDIDAVFKSRENETASSKETNLAFEGGSPSALTFMGLLNAIDGVASAEDGQLVFMTTNYPERLDPALIRPGRVDLRIAVDYPSDKQIGGMFKKFFPEKKDDNELVEKFVTSIRKVGKDVSMAMVQGLLVVYKNDPDGAINLAGEHFEDQFAQKYFK